MFKILIVVSHGNTTRTEVVEFDNIESAKKALSKLECAARHQDSTIQEIVEMF